MIFGKAVNKYYIQNLHWLLLGIITILVIDYAQLEIPTIIGDLIGQLDDGTIDKAGLVAMMYQIGKIVLIIMIGRFFWRFFIFGSSRRFDYGIRNDMFKHAEKLSNKFYSEHKVGALMAYFTNDLEAVRHAIGPGMIMLLDTLFLGGLAMYKMAKLDVSLTLISAIPLLFIALLGAYLGNKMRKRFREAQKAFEELSDFTNENLAGISVVKAFVKEKREIQEFAKYNTSTKEKNIEFVKLQALLQISTRTVVGIIYVAILGYGGYLVYQTNLNGGTFDIGSLTAFFMLFSSLIWPMMALSMIINIRSRGKASLQRINSILDEEIDVYDQTVDYNHEISGEIEFKNLDFQYPDGTINALSNISFRIQTGEMVGILGRTGSGKTSIVDLLLRIYNVEEGKLFLDNHDIMRLPIKQVRESIGYVPQDGFLFSDTIKNNISFSYGRKNEMFPEIEEAAKLSDVHENIIDFTQGYDTIIGERGITLSGGQRQRLSIARALIKNPPILIMDDSVSAVDTKTEETILNNLQKTRKGKTTIIIAHRISTVKGADKIIVVDDGKIKAVGTHDELLETCDFYKDMVLRQKLEDEMEV